MCGEKSDVEGRRKGRPTQMLMDSENADFRENVLSGGGGET